MQRNVIATIAAAVLLTVGWSASSAAASEPSDAVGVVREGGASADRSPATRNGSAVVGGGSWSYGVWSGEVHSVYVHDRSTHRASVRSSGITTRSDWVPPTKVAYAHRKKAVSGNQSFWATRG
jgi:lactococcin 972 family bacteriocin